MVEVTYISTILTQAAVMLIVVLNQICSNTALSKYLRVANLATLKIYERKNMIKLLNIEKEYNFRNQKIVALNKVNITFDYEKIYVIMGHSGCGKSTLLHLMGLLDSPTAGEIIFDKTKLKQLNEIDKDNIRALKIGYVFQDFYLNSKLTAYENVLLPMLINKDIKKQDRVTIVENLLKLVGLEKMKNKYPKELSGGEQQRVAIARALANNPKID